jgi:hypothetical protein
MFSVSEDRRHRIAQLVSGDRYELVTRADRLRQLRSKSCLLALERCRSVEAGELAVQPAKFGSSSGASCMFFFNPTAVQRRG